MKKKIVFLDIDGTLYSYKVGIPDSTKLAIKLLIENGHIPIICTGRTRVAISDEIMDLGFKGIVAGCGTYLEYDEKVLLNQRIEEKELPSILNLCRGEDLCVIIEAFDCLYYDKQLTERKYVKIIKDWKKATGAMISGVENGIKDVNKITLCSDNPKEALKFAREVDHILYPVSQHFYKAVELVPKGISKATGVKEMLNFLGASLDDTYAFGDSNNDLPMLETVKYGVAMGNSSNELLSRIKYVTDSVLEDGIYNGFKKFGLI